MRIKKKLAESVLNRGFSNIYFVEDMQEAVEQAGKIASPGDTVLLSPASPSWDQYDNFEERGQVFRQWVLRLEED